MDAGFVDLYQKNSPRVNPLMVPRVMSSGAASHMSMEFGVTGPVYSVSTACSSANHAIGQAFWMVRSGMCESVLAGGCESVFSYGFLKAWEAMRVVSSDTCRPFSRDRKGLILGEGAGVLVMEDLMRRSREARGSMARLSASVCHRTLTTLPSLRLTARRGLCGPLLPTRASSGSIM